MAPSAVISPQEMPDASRKEVDFPESSFFNVNGAIQSLSKPAEVRSLSPTHNTSPEPPPVVFESLGLLVKFGPYVTIAEAQFLWIIKNDLAGKSPFRSCMAGGLMERMFSYTCNLFRDGG
jgi:hypothetical protein